MSARLPFTLASCSTAGFVLQLYALPRLTRVSGNCLRPSAVPRQTLYSLDKNIPLGPTSPYISPQIYWRYSRLPAPTCIRASSRAAHNRTAVTSASTLNALPGACMACCCRERCQFKIRCVASNQIQQQNTKFNSKTGEKSPAVLVAYAGAWRRISGPCGVLRCASHRH